MFKRSIAPSVQTPSINQAEVPIPRQRSLVGTPTPPGTETIFINHYQSPDPGQIEIPNPGLRTRPALRYHQIHGNDDWYWQDNELNGEKIPYRQPPIGPYTERADQPNFGPSRVTIARRVPVTTLTQGG